MHILYVVDVWADLGELVEGDLPVLVEVHGSAELLDDLTHAVSRQGQVRLLEELVQLIGADVTVTVHVCGKRSKVSADALNDSSNQSLKRLSVSHADLDSFEWLNNFF